MPVTGCSFGPIRAGGVTCDHDPVTGRGEIRKRTKAASPKFRRIAAYLRARQGGMRVQLVTGGRVAPD